MDISNKQSEEEIINSLSSSGYDEKIIRKAFTMTKSRDIDDIVDIILDLENQRSSCHVKQVVKETPVKKNEDPTKILEDNKKAILADRLYREELIRRYQEDKRRQQEDLIDIVPDEKVVEIKGDCVFNVRFPDYKSHKLYFNKEDTIEDLFKKIEEIYGSSNFLLYKMRDSKPIERSNEEIQSNKKIFPKAALYIE